MFLDGFLLTISLIAAIGPQNTFVLKHGILRHYVFLTAFLSSFFNAILIILGVLGIGTLLKKYPLAESFLMWGGVAFLTTYSLLSLISALKKNRPSKHISQKNLPSLKRTFLLALMLSWANPMTLLENTILIGALSSQYDPKEVYIFALGGITASFAWFFGVGYAATRLSRHAEKAILWRIIDFFVFILCGSIATRILLQLLT